MCILLPSESTNGHNKHTIRAIGIGRQTKRPVCLDMLVAFVRDCDTDTTTAKIATIIDNLASNFYIAKKKPTKWKSTSDTHEAATTRFI